MDKIKLRCWDSAEHLKTEEDIALYLEACLEEAGDDAAFIAKALENIARARGMTHACARYRAWQRKPLQSFIRRRQPQLFAHRQKFSPVTELLH